MLLNVRLPHEAFNKTVSDGSVGTKLNKILEATKPEAVYFTAQKGMRCAVLIVDLPDAAKIPSLAEPWFPTFGADIELSPVMSPQELQRAGLDDLGKTWG
jgi:hypothetical protein